METNKEALKNGEAGEVQNATKNNPQRINAIEEFKQKQKEKEEPETVGKRKYSPNYMLNNYKTLIKNLDETGMLEEEDMYLLKELGKKMVTRYISIDMFE